MAQAGFSCAGALNVRIPAPQRRECPQLSKSRALIIEGGRQSLPELVKFVFVTKKQIYETDNFPTCFGIYLPLADKSRQYSHLVRRRFATPKFQRGKQ